MSDFLERIECVWKNPHTSEWVEGFVSRVQYDYRKASDDIIFYPKNPEDPISQLLIPMNELIFKSHKPESKKLYIAIYGLLRLQDSEDSRLLRGAIKKVKTIRLPSYQLYIPKTVYYPLVTFDSQSSVIVDIVEIDKESLLYLNKKETSRGMNLEILNLNVEELGDIEVGIYTFKNGTFGMNLCTPENKGATGNYIIDRITMLKNKADALLGRTAL